MNKVNILISTTIASLLAACSSAPVVLAPVGPAPASGEAAFGEGTLKVYTATETHEIGEDTYYYPHTGYEIYAEDGKPLHYVANHFGDMDDAPMTVRLPGGRYTIRAQADGCGRVTVPVVIRAGQLTRVNLEAWGRKRKPVTDESTVVRLPNGYVAGWRAMEPGVPKS